MKIWVKYVLAGCAFFVLLGLFVYPSYLFFHPEEWVIAFIFILWAIACAGIDLVNLGNILRRDLSAFSRDTHFKPPHAVAKFFFTFWAISTLALFGVSLLFWYI